MLLTPSVPVKCEGRRGSFVIEVSEWYDWLLKEIASGTLKPQDEQTCVFTVAQAVKAADGVEPYFYGRLRKSIREKIIKAHIILQCWENDRLPRT